MVVIQSVAGPQCGVAHVQQLRAAGVGSSSLSRLVARGLARRVFSRVYAFGAAAIELSSEARLIAIVLQLGDDSAVSHSTAAHLLGFWDRPDRTIHASTIHRRAPLNEPLVAVHRSIHTFESSSALVGKVRVTSPTRTLVELGQDLTKFQCCRALHLADFANALDLRAFEELLDQRRGEPGTSVARNARDLHLGGSSGTKSRSEDRGLWLLRTHGIPEPLVNNRLIDGLEGNEPDFAWSARRYIVELDGGGHRLIGMPAYDASRQRLYESEGWFVRRFDARVVWDEPEHFIATVTRDLARQRRSLTSRSRFSGRACQ